jgi:hypothetical protein
MNVKQIAILAMVLVVCVAGALFLKSRNETTVKDPSELLGKKAFPALEGDAVNDIGEVVIRDRDAEVVLKRGDKVWEVVQRDGYAADFEKITNFLRDIYDLKIADVIRAGVGAYDKLQLNEPTVVEKEEKPEGDDAGDAAGTDDGEEDDGTGMLVVFNDENGGEISRFIVGSEHSATSTGPFGSFNSANGRFIKTPDSGDQQVWLVAETFSQIKSDPAQWLDKDFFKVAKVKTIAFTASDPADSWKLTRDEELGDFTLVDANEDEQFEASKAGPLKNAFSSPSFKDVVVGAEDATTGLDTPERFEIETFEGFRYGINVGNATDDGDYYLTLTVDADFPKEYVPEPEGEGEDEAEGEADEELSEDEKKKQEEEKEAAEKKKKEDFEKEVERKEEKLETEKGYEGTVYLVNKWSVDSLMKKRSELMKEEEEDDSAGAGAGAATGVSTPAGTVATPPIAIPNPAAPPEKPKGPITAVTPPIEVKIPPREDAEEAPDDGGTEGEDDPGSPDEPDGSAPE